VWGDGEMGCRVWGVGCGVWGVGKWGESIKVVY